MFKTTILLSNLSRILLVIIIIAGLVNTEYFYSSTSAAYYGFCITVLFFAITPYHFQITNNRTVTFKIPLLLFGLCCFYVLIHYFTNTGTLVFTIYSVALYFLLLKATTLFSSPNFKFKLFFVSIAGIAMGESMYCIGQFFGGFKSQSKLFAVTGSWNNPNVTAIFLALTVPVFLNLFQDKYKKIVLTGFLSVLISLLLLKCRAAFIGTVLSIIVFYGLEYQFINWVKNKKNNTSAKALLILGLLIIIPLSSQLYNAKKDSADGRKFIWKVSAIMAFERPVTGYGYGSFEKEYNLYQANYIQNDKATAEEVANAGPVIMPHNELIQNVVEGGIIGLILISLFFGSLLFAVKQKNRTEQKKLNTEAVSQAKNSVFHLAYAGVVSFIGMSMVNSTIQIVPIMCLLIIYAAIVCSTLNPIEIPRFLSFVRRSKAFSIASKTVIIAISVYLLYLLLGMATADRKNKEAKLLKEAGHYEQSLQIMPDLEPYLKEDSHYWDNYGHIYFKAQKFQEAIICFKKAKALSTLPEFYMGAGICYEKLHQYPKVIQQYETLIALYPSKFLYRMLLLETYFKNKNFSKAIFLAQEIIQMKPKIPSEKVERYKNICRGLLKELSSQKTNNQQFQ
ncbi:hypothetical protein EOD40_16255 [Flavobacterium sufflavum]|uniref:O-antigen ligase-related domain-containing protein n=1 Tax=Flavobacterium sufflavum TaxID=1921138 RepID=A0A437KLH4_9FLAO|nr:tetratricopeptide repeat protein [Flavobacterium sufflavum]RVT71972.1 hypothetical protein EOD40_16255 [Flavobacterium sufflavum]